MDKHEIETLLQQADAAALCADGQAIAHVQVLLTRGIPGYESPLPTEGAFAEKMDAMDKAFVDHYIAVHKAGQACSHEGLAEQIYQIMHG